MSDCLKAVSDILVVFRGKEKRDGVGFLGLFLLMFLSVRALLPSHAKMPKSDRKDPFLEVALWGLYKICLQINN